MRSAIEQQLGEAGVGCFASIVTPEIRIANYRAEQRGVSTESVLIDSRLRVDVGAFLDEPFRDLEFIPIDTHVKQSGPVQRCALRIDVLRAAELRRKDLLMRKGALE